jgi:hypothetical protein
VTSREERQRRSLGRIIRQAVQTAVQEAQAKVREPKILSGTIEQLDEDKDVAYVRMDAEAMSGDPTQSLNYEMPGVIPTTRMGEAYDGDQVRVSFDGTAGASAFRTSGENVIVLPYGAETGRRIILDGDAGVIAFFDEADQLVGLLDTEQWAIGNVGTLGARVTLDPVGGVRIRTANDAMVVLIDQNGVTLRDAVTGLVVADLKPGSFRMVDPSGTDDIEMVTSSVGTLPNPAYRNLPEVNPGASFVAPGAPVFTKPIDDIEIAHVAGWRRAVNQPATMAIPGGFTERTTPPASIVADAAGTLQTSIATRDPAVANTAATFTSNVATWDHALGSTVILKGGGTVSPSFRSVAEDSSITTDLTFTSSVAKPAGLAVGDVILAFVSLGVNGGLVPTGWVTPTGFNQLGAWFSTSGSGLTQSTLSTGVWAKLATADDVAATEFSTTINLPTGTKVIHAALVAIQNCFLVPGGVQIRMAGKPIRRLLAYAEITGAANQTLCDFTPISQAYDNLELVWDGTSAAALGGNQQLLVRFNGATTNNYYYRNVRDGAALAFGVPPAGGSGVATNGFRIGALSGTNAGVRTAGSLHIYGYTRSRATTLGRAMWLGGASSLEVVDETHSGQFDIAAPVTRVALACQAADPKFAIGSRAYLYGY